MSDMSPVGPSEVYRGMDKTNEDLYGIKYAPSAPEVPVNGMRELTWRHSENLGLLAAALAKSQLLFKPVKKTVENVFYSTDRKKAMYADLAGLIEATQPALAANELVVIQLPITDIEKQRAGVVSRLQHSSNEWIECELMLPATARTKEWKDGVQVVGTKFDAQTCGIAITYTRRYTYGPVIGIAAEEDSDANEISEPGTQGSKEAAQAVAKQKVQDSGVVPSLFWQWDDESQTATIVGTQSLKEANRDLLAKHWSQVAGQIVVNAEQLEDLKYEFAKRNVPFVATKGVVEEVKKMAAKKKL